MDITPKWLVPHKSVPELEYKNSYYAVPLRGLWHYFPIKVDPDTADKPVTRFLKTPPLLIDGIVMFGKKMYGLTADDILRNRILKVRELNSGGENNGTKSRKSKRGATSTSVVVSNVDSSPALPRDTRLDSVNGVVDLEEFEAINRTSSDQIETLLHHLSQEEGGEWEVA